MENKNVIVKIFHFEIKKYIDNIDKLSYRELSDKIAHIESRNWRIAHIIDILRENKENILVLSHSVPHLKLLGDRIYNNGQIVFITYSTFERIIRNGFDYRNISAIILASDTKNNSMNHMMENVSKLKSRSLKIIDITDDCLKYKIFEKKRKENYEKNNCKTNNYIFDVVNVYDKKNIITLKNALLDLNCYNFISMENYDINFKFYIF